MARAEANLKHCMITQQIIIDYFKGWNTPEDISALEELAKGNIKPFMVQAIIKLSMKGLYIREAYGIIHGGDIRDMTDPVQKEEHLHFMIKFFGKVNGKEVQSTLTNIAEALGVEKQYVEKPKSGKYSYDNMLSYLIHIKDEHKTPHDPSEVVYLGLSEDKKTISEEFCKPYMDIYNENLEQWLKGRAKKKLERNRNDIDWLIEEILQGRLNKDTIMLTDELFDIYRTDRRRCEEALEIYGERRIYRTIKDMKDGNMQVVTFYIQGDSKAGKTTFADALAYKIKEYAKANGLGEWASSDAAAKNPVDDYQGEEIFFMDDSRGISMGITDWLNLLDPNRINKASARYHNKNMACRVIIITATMSPVEFFSHLKDDAKGQGHTESMNQFLRRIWANIHVFRCADDERKVCIETNYETAEYFIHPNMVDKNTGRQDTRKASIAFKSDYPELESLPPKEALDILARTVILSNQLAGTNKNPYLK